MVTDQSSVKRKRKKWRAMDRMHDVRTYGGKSMDRPSTSLATVPQKKKQVWPPDSKRSSCLQEKKKMSRIPRADVHRAPGSVAAMIQPSVAGSSEKTTLSREILSVLPRAVGHLHVKPLCIHRAGVKRVTTPTLQPMVAATQPPSWHPTILLP